jgi:hypothetical protein
VIAALSTRTLFGLLLIAVGAVILLDQTGAIDADTSIGEWWPVVIIVLGLGQLAEQRRVSIGPLIVTGVGVLLLLVELDVLPGSFWDYFWPTTLIAFGVWLVLRRNAPQLFGGPEGNAGEFVSASAFFSGNEVVSTSAAFRGASLTAAFGATSLDLREATLDPRGATVSMVAVFGGCELIVPRGWHIDVHGLPIFGGVDNKANAPTLPSAPLLRVDATVLFGGIEIKHEK